MFPSLTFVLGGHEALQPLGPVTVLLPLGSALLVHVGRYIRGQKLRLQLTQGNVDQTKLGARAVRQTAGAFNATIVIFSVQTLRKRDGYVEGDRQSITHRHVETEGAGLPGYRCRRGCSLTLPPQRSACPGRMTPEA